MLSEIHKVLIEYGSPAINSTCRGVRIVSLSTWHVSRAIQEKLFSRKRRTEEEIEKEGLTMQRLEVV